MGDLRKRLDHAFIRPAVRALQPWRHVTYGDVRVGYKRYLDGGGSAFGQDYIPFLLDRGMPRQARIFEWCAGPAFIGFSLLGFGLCDTLCLADINPDAVRACRRTIAANGLKDCVTVYRSNNLDDIPETERWDPKGLGSRQPGPALPDARECLQGETALDVARSELEAAAISPSTRRAEKRSEGSQSPAAFACGLFTPSYIFRALSSRLHLRRIFRILLMKHKSSV